MKVTPCILLDNGSVSTSKEREKVCVCARARARVCVCLCVLGGGSCNTANEHISVFHFLQMFSGFHMSAACSSIQFGIANLGVAFDGGHVYPLYLSLVFMPGIQSGIVLEERGRERGGNREVCMCVTISRHP